MITVNKILKPQIIIFLLLMIIPIQNNFAQSSSFYVFFTQTGKRVKIEKNRVELKKQDFKMFIEYTKPVDLFVNISQKPKTYLNAKKGKLMFNLKSFSNLKKSKSFFLKKNELCFSEEKPLIWKKKETDGGKVIKTKRNHFVVSKNIEKVFDKEEKTTILLKDIKKKIYLVFIYAEKDSEGDYQEIQRELVKIKWVDNYDKDTKSYARKKKQADKLKIRQAKTNLKQKQRLAKKEKKRLKKIEEHKLKKAEKNLKNEEKEKKKVKK